MKRAQVTRLNAELLAENKRRCSQCATIKSLADFYRCASNISGYHHCCRECQAKYEQRPNRRAERKSHSLARRYGITREQYDDLFEKQHGVCAICGKPETQRQQGSPSLLCVDHEHVTGRIRALLCRTCNQAIGLLHEDAALMERAAAYLRSHSA